MFEWLLLIFSDKWYWFLIILSDFRSVAWFVIILEPHKVCLKFSFWGVSAFRMISTGSIWNNWASWVDEIYFSWYLAWFWINLIDLRRFTLFSITLEALKVCSKFYVGCLKVVLRDDRTILEVGHINFFSDSENIAFGLLKNDFG